MRVALMIFTIVLCCTTFVAAAERVSLQIFPAEVTLADANARQSLIVERVQANGTNGVVSLGQVSDGIAWSVADPKVVAVEAGTLRPLSDGRTTITARTKDATAQATVVVKNFTKPTAWSFRNQVESVMAKTGCSSGPCHGAQAGKAGFKLSLFGFDPEGDYLAITRHARGRRVTPSDPGRSLLLTKPTGALPHKGGVRFDTESAAYRVMSEWIAAGMPAPSASDPRLLRVEVLPQALVLKPGEKQQLVLLAHYDDGHTADVTAWGRYTTTNSTLAQVDERGAITVSGYGEGSITAWFSSKIALTAVTSPYPQAVSAERFVQGSPRNFIDELVLDKLRHLNVPPSPAAGDSEFLRRAMLDTIGVLPTADEARAFLQDKSSDKRDRLIESLLHRPEFVDYWTYKWSDLLLVNSDKLKPATGGGDTRNSPMWSYYAWIRNHVEANTPWDELVRQLVTATGSTLDNGAANYYVLHKDPFDRAETTTVAFLGMSINCARCHNHPLEKWTNDQYYAFANLFARVRSKAGSVPGSDVVFVADDGDLPQPLTGKPQPPTPLDGQPLSLASTVDRRQALAQWLTSPENPYFTRSIVNRVWANFFGVGLVEMVDDLRLTNPASNEALLQASAQYLVQQKYDLKQLMRLILQSQTYQRSSQPLKENLDDRRFYSRYYPRRLMAEVLLDAMSEVTQVPSAFANYPSGWRALQLPDSLVASDFLNTFGRAERVVTCECERSTEPSMVQVLNISNGGVLNGKLSAKENRITHWLAKKASDADLIDELYLSALSRFPTPREKTSIVSTLAETPAAERRAVIEDLVWGVLSSKEFLFNH